MSLWYTSLTITVWISLEAFHTEQIQMRHSKISIKDSMVSISSIENFYL